jgi:enoyl-CoA hydratase/carnithine racemase
MRHGEHDLVIYRCSGGIAEIVLNRPDKLNAISDDVALSLRHALEQFDDDPDAYVGILYGLGRAFCSGADVKQRQLRSDEEMRRLGGPQGRGPKTADMLFGMTNWKPVISAVHGYAVGAGLRLALETELIVAEEGAKFQVTETSRGVDGSIFWRLMSKGGATAFADEVSLTGRFWTAEEGAQAGLISRVTDKGTYLEEARSLAGAIMANPPLAVRQIVRVRRAEMQSMELAYSLSEARDLHLSADFRESARAFAERRAPGPWLGR